MNEHNSEHGEHGEVHLPDPSVWPLIVGLAALLMGLALVYWTRDRQSNFSGPLLGAGVLGVLIAAFGWAYEDGRMKRKAEAHELTTRRNARFTQVLTFGIAEGRLGAARSGGILSAMETSDSALRDLAGFQDMRIIAAPADAGPSQVLVETTWSDREGLATYEETRATLLDMVAQHPDDVVPGSVQVFDMEVVRDTKDIGFRFGMGAATAVFASLAVGGLMLGAGLTAFQKESTAAATVTPGGNGGGADTSVITATDNHFSTNALVAPPNTKVSFTLKNTGKSIHNLHFYDKQGGQTLADGAGSTDTTVPSGTSDTLTFTTPAAGTYYFQCDFHPTEMNGVLTVKEGAPVPGPSGGATTGGSTAPAAGGLALTATDNKFDKTTLSAPNGPVTVNFTNAGKTPHDLHFYDKKGGQTLATGSDGQQIVSPGKSETLTFTPPGPGTYYYQCDLHPDQMNGVFTVQ